MSTVPKTLTETPRPGGEPTFRRACSTYGKEFVRSEYLAQHNCGAEAKIMPRKVTCTICAKAFTRNEGLKRHTRSAHERRGGTSTSKRKSCLRCVNQKAKCTGSRPSCENCAKRGIQCSFSQEQSPPYTTRGSNLIYEPIYSAPDIREDAFNTQPNFGASSAFLDLDTTKSTSFNNATEIPCLETESVFGRQKTHTSALLVEKTVPFTEFADGNPFDEGMYSLNWPDFSVSPSYPSRLPNSIDLPYNIADIPLPSPRPIRSKSHWMRFWQADDHIIEAAHLTLEIKFPAAEMPILDQTRCNIIKVLGAAISVQPHSWMDLNCLPSKEVLGHCLMLYFAHHHPIQPILHLPTFNPDEAPEGLLMVLIGIGSVHASCEGASKFANTMVHLAVRTLIWMGEIDPNYRRTMFYIVGLLLAFDYAVGAGNKKLYEEMGCLRTHVVANASYMGLFDRPSWEDNWNDSDDLHTHWIEWRDEELRKRFVWAIFALDNNLSPFGNARPCISLWSITQHLPCDEVFWEAPTAQDWARTYQSTRKPLRGPPFLPVFAELLSAKTPSFSLSTYAKRHCAQTLQRIFMDLKELESTPLGRMLPLFQDSHPASKGMVLKGLMCLLATITPTNDLTEQANNASVTVITHYAHLYAPRGALTKLSALIRAQPETRGAILAAMKMEANADQCTARRSAWHAAQIISVARNCPMNSAGDIIRVFMAGYYLFVFCKHFSHSDNLDACCANLDFKPSDGGKMPIEWINNGGTAIFEKIPITSNDSSSVLHNVLLETLHHMRAWGLSLIFYHIFSRAAQDEPDII